LKAIFNIKIVSIDQGMKYLGFNLKPNNYKVNDWMWILKKIEKRIRNWTFRWLSLGGRLTLETSVLQSIPVYWLSLVKFPTSVLNRIQNLISKFIWKGGKKGIGFHLTKWKNIARPKLLGGWGIKHISWFAQSLSAKSCWRGLFRTGLWNTVLCKKYLKGMISSLGFAEILILLQVLLSFGKTSWIPSRSLKGGLLGRSAQEPV
jgi:hypothetical protein